MFGSFREWLQRRRVRKSEKEFADCIELEFFGQRTTRDTVVFVHGLGGHFSRTWGDFPKLLRSDLDLPRFDILLWGYDASPFPGTVGISAEGRRLMSDLRENLPNAENVFFVAHSLGGLTVLRGLCDEHADGRARKLPAQAVNHVFLYATPVLGVRAATLSRMLAGYVGDFTDCFNTYISELAPGHTVNSLLKAVLERVYHPRIEPGDENSKRQIPLTACVALADEWVEPSSAEAVFTDPPPVFLQFNHVNVKLPRSHGDRRYKPVRKALTAYFSDWLRELAGRAVSHSSDGAIAARQIAKRCEEMIDFIFPILPKTQNSPSEQPDPGVRRLELIRTMIELSLRYPKLSVPEVLALAGEIYAGEDSL